MCEELKKIIFIICSVILIAIKLGTGSGLLMFAFMVVSSVSMYKTVFSKKK